MSEPYETGRRLLGGRDAGDGSTGDGGTEFSPVPVRRLRQQVEIQIREAIASRRLTEGDKLPSESDLASMFAVSRSTVREALRSLDAAGLIEKVPGASGGSFVRSVDHVTFGRLIGDSMEILLQIGNADLHEVLVVRGLLEVPSCRLAAMNRSDEELRIMHEIIEGQRAAAVGDPSVPGMDIEFHSAIARASGNRVLAALVHGLHRSTKPVTRLPLSEEDGHRTVRQHISIVKAIEAGDPDAAEVAIKEHLEYLEDISAARGGGAVGG